MVQIIGHRGVKAYEPENTLRSIQRALGMGVDAVEIDVHLSRDGYLTVIHDDTVDRTTDGRGLVRDLTWEELRRLDAGQGERIPGLDEVVELTRGRCHLVVELKDPQAVSPLAAFFRKHQLFEVARVISFWHPAVKALRELEPRIKTGVLLVGQPVDAPALARSAGAEALFLNYAYVTQESAQAAKSAGLLLYIWNIDTIVEFIPFLEMDIDGIGSNKPDILIQYLRNNYGKHRS